MQRRRRHTQDAAEPGVYVSSWCWLAAEFGWGSAVVADCTCGYVPESIHRRIGEGVSGGSNFQKLRRRSTSVCGHIGVMVLPHYMGRKT
jgi:hypothetical protein